ncbi:MAG TPA: site-specific integrase [Lachnospiraceae bacterium]|nr:site-specific integrase [Lachnospiraceae bacterium]
MTEQEKSTNVTGASANFEEIAHEWMKFLKPQLKESTIVKYTNILNLYVLPEYRRRQISEIGRGDVTAFGNKLLTVGGAKNTGLSPKTVTGIISVIKSIFQYASQEGGYPFVADVRNISFKQSQKPMRVLSRTEQQKFGGYLSQNLSLRNLGILLCLYTGLRIGEICALKWEDILFDEQYVYVHCTMQRLQTLVSGETKTAVLISTPKSDCSIRKIPIPDALIGLLTENRHSPEAFFLTGSPNRYVEPRTMQNHYRNMAKDCGIEDTHFHTLRHTFATRCVELGFDAKSLSEILGHATVNITMNRYVHPSMELKQKNMNMLSGLLSGK